MYSLPCVQLFKKEEQNFVFANEIDNMALIMPSQDKAKAGAPDQADAPNKSSKARAKSKMGITQSLNVACLRRCVRSYPGATSRVSGGVYGRIQAQRRVSQDVCTVVSRRNVACLSKSVRSYPYIIGFVVHVLYSGPDIRVFNCSIDVTHCRPWLTLDII